MITERDKLILDYLKRNEADFKTLHQMFFQGLTTQAARYRLTQLVQRGHIKKRKGVDDQYTIFYMEG